MYLGKKKKDYYFLHGLRADNSVAYIWWRKQAKEMSHIVWKSVCWLIV